VRGRPVPLTSRRLMTSWPQAARCRNRSASSRSARAAALCPTTDAGHGLQYGAFAASAAARSSSNAARRRSSWRSVAATRLLSVSGEVSSGEIM
jgi:hypothetical protein